MFVKYADGKYNCSVYVKDEGEFKSVNMPEWCYVKILHVCGIDSLPPKCNHAVYNIRSLVLNRSSGILSVRVTNDYFESKHYIRKSTDIEFFNNLEIL